jgi:formylglycine-generating enzyme required for sulfatase activity
MQVVTRRFLPLLITSGLAALAVAACSLVVPLDGIDDGAPLGDGGGDGDASIDAGPDVAPDVAPDAPGADAGDAGDSGKDASCPGTAGPVMIDLGGYCIDSTEVTRAQYDQFLKTNPSTNNQPAECAWNATFLPSPFDLSKPDFPVVYVDWCDAYAYCKWAGKRMCGKIGGGPLPFGAAATDPNQSQWYRACSKNGTQTYPYGNVYDPAACNGAEDGGAIAAVKTFNKCAGGYPGLFDMAGNVEEWQDSCLVGDAGSAADQCRDQSGSYGYVPPASSSTQCGFVDNDGRSNHLPDVGIRCCAP